MQSHKHHKDFKCQAIYLYIINMHRLQFRSPNPLNTHPTPPPTDYLQTVDKLYVFLKFLMFSDYTLIMLYATVGDECFL